MYSFPNIILPVFGGYLVDMIGARTGNFLFALLIAIGQGIFAFGVSIKSYPICLFGRGVFGLGGESLNVSENYSIVGWFTGKELSMAIGSTISISRLGSVLNDNIEPAIVSSTNSLSFGLWIGFALCLFSLTCAILQNMIDKKKDNLLGILERKHLPASEKFRFADVKTFGTSFWLLCINCIVVYIDVSCFNNIASNYFQERFQYTSVEAGSIISITYIVAAILCPFFGRIVDKVGKRVEMMMFSCISVSLVHVCFLFTPESNKPIYPIFYMVLLGLGYSIYASVIWASIPYLVVNKVTGTAFGVATALQNFGLGFGPLFIGYIQENTEKDKGYYWVSFFFVIVGLVGICSCILLYLNDIRTGGILRSAEPVDLKQSIISNSSQTEYHVGAIN